MFVPWLRWSVADISQPKTGFNINNIQFGIYVGRNYIEVSAYQNIWFSVLYFVDRVSRYNYC